MAKVSNVHGGDEVVAPTPTQQVVNDANRVVYGKDAKGRKLGVIRFNASVRRRVYKALTEEQAGKVGYFIMAATACCCVSIDDEHVPFPRTELQVDALIDRLEEEGIAAIGLIAAEHFESGEGDAVKN